MLPNNPSFSSRQDLLDPSSPAPSQPSSPPSSGSRRAGSDPPVPEGPRRADGQFCVEPPTDEHPPNGEAELLCGWGTFRPRALQGLASPPWVLLFLSVASFLQGMTVNGFINTVITSIERRFQLSSSQTGVVSSSYDMAACICLAFVSYFGGAGHKPRWLGGGMLLMALGSLLFTLPHFATPPYQVSVSERAELCSAGRTAPCHAQEAGPSSYRFLFMLGQFLHGVGATPLYTLGVTYLDENVGSNYAPVYIGESVCCSSCWRFILAVDFLKLQACLTCVSKPQLVQEQEVGCWDTPTTGSRPLGHTPRPGSHLLHLHRDLLHGRHLGSSGGLPAGGVLPQHLHGGPPGVSQTRLEPVAELFLGGTGTSPWGTGTSSRAVPGGTGTSSRAVPGGTGTSPGGTGTCSSCGSCCAPADACVV